MIKAKVFRIFIRMHSIFKSERLSVKIKLTLHKSLISSVMTYAGLTWELAADSYILILQCLQKKVLRTTGNFPRCTPLRDFHTVFNLRIYTII
jgi:hypothetical protein